MRPKSLLLAWVCLLGACGSPRRPNILLVVIDTTRADHLSIGGYGRPTDPTLALLAREGVSYTQAYTPAPWTVPAHASLFTGQYPSLHGVDCGSLRLPDGVTTLAETLHDGGYRTAAATANPWISTTYNFQQGFETFIETWRSVPVDSEDTGARLTNEEVTRFLRWRQGNPDARDQPFFMFINYFEPHLPYHPPEPERSKFLRPSAPAERVATLSHLGHPDEMRFILGLSDLTRDDLGLLSDLYDGEIAYADRRLGEVLQVLRELRLLDDTVVAVTGDHGENLGDHGMLDHKMSVHDTLLHVPLVLRYPRRIAGGQVIASPVQMHDLYPTLLALAGVPPPRDATVEAVPLPGSGVPGPYRRQEDPIVGEFAGPPVDFLKVMKERFPGADLARFDRTLVSLRSEGYTILWGSDGRHALFRISGDEGQAEDLAGREPERLARMESRVQAWLARPARSRRVSSYNAP